MGSKVYVELACDMCDFTERLEQTDPRNAKPTGFVRTCVAQQKVYSAGTAGTLSWDRAYWTYGEWTVLCSACASKTRVRVP